MQRTPSLSLTSLSWEFSPQPPSAPLTCAAPGLEDEPFPWGSALDAQRCNGWTGGFPAKNDLADGHLGAAPVDAFEPNGFGIYKYRTTEPLLSFSLASAFSLRCPLRFYNLRRSLSPQHGGQRVGVDAGWDRKGAAPAWGELHRHHRWERQPRP